jgi:hypothetical protein
MLAAGNGDALWIEYGTEAAPRRVLIDGGTGEAWDEGLRARVAALSPADRRFELLVVTHIDADHIDGVLRLLGDQELCATFGDVWFNGWRHLPQTPLESLGPVEGERLTDLLVAQAIPWNDAFAGRAVAVKDDSLPRHTLDGGLDLTVLSPDAKRLAALKPVWRKVVGQAGLDPDKEREPVAAIPTGLERLGAGAVLDVPALADLPFKSDTAEANGSSIVVLLEYEGKAVVLAGDAFPAVVQTAAERLLVERAQERLAADAFKLPHHGSHANISREFLAKLDCPRYLFSSNGAHTRHPHPESIARVLVTAASGSALMFNYKTRYNEMWADDALSEQYTYEAIYPEAEQFGLAVTL